VSEPIVLPPGSGPSGPPANVRQPRPRRIGDTIGSIVLLFIDLAAYFIGLVFSVLTLSATDRCTSETCNVDGALTAQSVTVIVLALVLLAGAVITLVFAFVLRRRAWPIALVTGILILLGWVVGAIVFFATLTA
jgi:DMSO reductase anchor subunit